MDGTSSALGAARLWRSAALGSLFCSVALAAFLLARRVTGEVSSPLTTALVLPTVALLVAWAWVVRLALQGCLPENRLLGVGRFVLEDAVFYLWLPIITLFGFAVALSLPSPRFIDWLAWIAAFAAVLLGPLRILRAPNQAHLRRRTDASDMIVQKLKRYRSPDGRESMRGTLSTQFVPEQRTATLYAAFCPPFEHLPQVTAHTHSGSASVKVAQVLHNGVQLEVRLAREATRNHVVTVDFFASEMDATC